MSLFKNAIVEKRNVLNELKATNFSLQELRLFTIYLSKVNPYDKRTREVKFTLSDYQRIMGLNTLNITKLKKSTKSLLSKSVLLPLESGGYDGVPLFKRFRLDKNELGEWYILIDVTDDMLPYVFDFRDRYFKYALWNALRLNSIAQVRMYEILKQYEYLGKREVEVSELKALLGITLEKYQRWERFRTQILDNCQTALKEKTDISFTYKRGKTGAGGKWLTIVFTISKNTPTDNQMMIEETFYQDITQSESGGAESVAAPEPQQLVFYDTKQNDYTDFFAGACENEFTASEIQSFMAIINTMTLPPHPEGIAFARYHYLLEVYTRFKARAESEPISNRCNYLYTMIYNDRKKQRGESQ